MTRESSGPSGRSRTTLITALVLLALAGGTRAVALGSFSWPDELTWLQRSSAFMVALERGDLAGTYLADHPGVVPMWGFGAALVARAAVTGDRSAVDALAAVAREADAPPAIPSAEIPPLLATAALFTVVVTSLSVAAAYALCIPLLGRTGAALAGLLLALDPFFLANSRIVHVDALLASFMLLSVLSLLVYMNMQRPGRRGVPVLILSGVTAGLAMLTKTPSLFLVPLALLLFGIQWLLARLGRLPAPAEQGAEGSRPTPALDSADGTLRLSVVRRRSSVRAALRDLGAAAGALAVWLATMYGTFLAAWPAAWLYPQFLTYRLFRASRWGVLVSHGSNFFLGRSVPNGDPGPLFYGVVFPFRLSPLVTLLLIAAVALLVVAWRRRRDVRVPVAGLAFIVFFAIMVSLAAKKGDRYLLPVYPVADVVAAWALVGLIDLSGAGRLPFGRNAGQTPGRSRMMGALAAAAILVTSLLWLPLAPHYGAYFNPLVGGGPVAARTFSFGQGEGLDLAADYLNGKENSRDLLAVSFYPQEFRYYFRGEVTSLRRGEWDQTWQFADYVVFYISQVQRDLPTPGLVQMFAAQVPEYTARLGGVDFAQVYRSPVLLSGRPLAVEQRLEPGAGLGDIFRVSGYALGAAQLEAGDELDVTLYWQAEQPPGADYEFELQLAGEDGRIVWRQARQPYDGHFPTSWWRPGRVMYDRYRLALPAGLRPGTYWLLAAARQNGAAQGLAPRGAVDDRWPDRLVVGPISVE